MEVGQRLSCQLSIRVLFFLMCECVSLQARRPERPPDHVWDLAGHLLHRVPDSGQTGVFFLCII